MFTILSPLSLSHCCALLWPELQSILSVFCHSSRHVVTVAGHGCFVFSCKNTNLCSFFTGTNATTTTTHAQKHTYFFWFVPWLNWRAEHTLSVNMGHDSGLTTQVGLVSCQSDWTRALSWLTWRSVRSWIVLFVVAAASDKLTNLVSTTYHNILLNNHTARKYVLYVKCTCEIYNIFYTSQWRFLTSLRWLQHREQCSPIQTFKSRFPTIHVDTRGTISTLFNLVSLTTTSVSVYNCTWWLVTTESSARSTCVHCDHWHTDPGQHSPSLLLPISPNTTIPDQGGRRWQEIGGKIIFILAISWHKVNGIQQMYN